MQRGSKGNTLRPRASEAQVHIRGTIASLIFKVYIYCWKQCLIMTFHSPRKCILVIPTSHPLSHPVCPKSPLLLSCYVVCKIWILQMKKKMRQLFFWVPPVSSFSMIISISIRLLQTTSSRCSSGMNRTPTSAHTPDSLSSSPGWTSRLSPHLGH